MKGSFNGPGFSRRLYLATACTAIFSLAWSTDVKAQSTSNSRSDHPIQIGSSPSWQAAAGGHLEFEVASVRPSAPGSYPGANMSMNTGDYLKPTGGLFTANLPLVTYIAFAYKLSLDHEQGKLLLDSLPKWASTQLFAVHARASSGNPTKDQYRLMMQSLLANRFKLVAHLEQRVVPVFALILVKRENLGPNLRLHSNGPPCNVPASENGSVPSSESRTPAGGNDSFPFNCGSFNLLVRPDNMVLTGSRDATMAALAMWLSGLGSADLDRTVVDQTGLDGGFDFSLKWAYVPPGSSPSDTTHPPEFMGLTFKRALNEQLGLELKPVIAPVDFFVVDHIETPSPN
jgi:bla regulator protein BlaR1